MGRKQQPVVIAEQEAGRHSGDIAAQDVKGTFRGGRHVEMILAALLGGIGSGPVEPSLELHSRAVRAIRAEQFPGKTGEADAVERPRMSFWSPAAAILRPINRVFIIEPKALRHEKIGGGHRFGFRVDQQRAVPAAADEDAPLGGMAVGRRGRNGRRELDLHRQFRRGVGGLLSDAHVPHVRHVAGLVDHFQLDALVGVERGQGNPKAAEISGQADLAGAHRRDGATVRRGRRAFGPGLPDFLAPRLDHRQRPVFSGAQGPRYCPSQQAPVAPEKNSEGPIVTGSTRSRPFAFIKATSPHSRQTRSQPS